MDHLLKIRISEKGLAEGKRPLLCDSWMNRFRRLPIRLEKKEDNYPAILRLACA